MNCNGKVSVVVPVYNVESYLEKCMDSIVGQTYSNLEIILVNDGSTDGSCEICEKYAGRDGRIKLISKKNGGLSDARNAGLDAASGEYLFFVDSDDFLELNAISELVSRAKAYEADVVVCNYTYAHEKDGNLIPLRSSAEALEVYETGTDFYRQCCRDNNRLGHSNLAWGKLYRMNLFKDIRFPVGKIHEDEMTIYKVLAEALRTVYLDDVLYYYVVRAGSIMSVKSPEQDLHRIEAYEERYRFFEARNENEIVNHTLSLLLGGYILDYYRIDNPETKKELYEKCKGVFREERKRFHFLKKCQYVLFLGSPKIYRIVRRMDG